MAGAKANQPGEKAPMTLREAGTEFAKDTVKDTVKDTAEDQVDQAKDYIQSDEGQQKISDAEDEVKGFFSKYCGCLSG